MRFLAPFFLGLILISPAGAAAWAGASDKPIPPAPRMYVLDEPHTLSPRGLEAVEALLIEHDRATGQQVLVGIFNSLDGQDINDYVNRVFQAWKIGQRGEDNGVLLALFMQDRQARIEVGYGLEPTLTDAVSSRILRDVLAPAMRAGKPDVGIAQSVVAILQTINSPLLQSGRAGQIMRSGNFPRYSATEYAPRSQGGWLVWLILGIVLMSIVWNSMTSAEAHFTRAGWYRPSPWQKPWPRGTGGAAAGGAAAGLGGLLGGLPWGGPWGGGGGGGDGGGFIGGGGMSGGGGASGGW